jgi:metallo-beta-lactamase class B
MRPHTYPSIAVTLAIILAGCVRAQAPNPVPAKPDSSPVLEHIEKAKQIAGKEWAGEATFFCTAPRANSPTDPLIEPTKLFDNLYAFGRSGTVVYAITTSAGIILIDSGYANEVESVLIAQMKMVGLDPAQVKTIILTHGHGDHFGGAAYFQDHYGTRIVESAADWDLMEHPPQPPAGLAAKGPPPAPVTPPRKDIVAEGGKPLGLGDEKVTPVMVPGHTPGSMALIFQVKDGGKTHIAGLYGGTVLLTGFLKDEQLQQYLKSLEHYKEIARKMKVDVEIQNHPLYDGMPEKLAALKDRKPGSPNPFVVGPGSYAKFLDVQSECMQAALARRSE